jgi:hypothetical protein
MSRRTVLFVIVGLALVCGMVLLSGSRKPLAKLKIVRLAVEQGKSVVYFRVEADTNRLLALNPFIKTLEDGTTEEFLIKSTSGLLVRAPNLFAPLQVSDPWDEGFGSPREFGVIAPTNSPVWKLRLRVQLVENHSFKTLSDVLRPDTRVGQILFGSTIAAAKWVWDAQSSTQNEIIESELITNAVAFSVPHL